MHKEWRAVPHVTDDGAYLIFVIEKGTDAKYRIVYRPLEKPESRPVHLVGDFEADYTFIDNDGPVFWFKTNKNAPRGKVVAIDTRRPGGRLGRSDPGGADTLESVTAVGGHFLARYLKDAHTMVRVFDLKGRHVRDVDIPGLGTASGFRGKRKDNETFYKFVSFTTPPTIYRYDVSTGRSMVWRAPKLKYYPADYETSQAFYRSKDGTRVPIFLSHKKGLKRDGHNPTLLYGYGGFNIPLTPAFNPPSLPGWKWAGFTPSPTCAAEESMAKTGTREERSSTNKTCLTTSSPPPNG